MIMLFMRSQNPQKNFFAHFITLFLLLYYLAKKIFCGRTE